MFGDPVKQRGFVLDSIAHGPAEFDRAKSKPRVVGLCSSPFFFDFRQPRHYHILENLTVAFVGYDDVAQTVQSLFAKGDVVEVEVAVEVVLVGPSDVVVERSAGGDDDVEGTALDRLKEESTSSRRTQTGRK